MNFYFSVDNYKNPVALQWYRALNPHQRLLVREECQVVLGFGFRDLLVCFDLLEIISLFHMKLVAEKVIPPCGYRKQEADDANRI